MRIWLASALGPASVIAWLSFTNVVDVPYWDDWFNTSTVLVEWHAGTLGIEDLLSLFEPATEAIRKGKASKPSESADAGFFSAANVKLAKERGVKAATAHAGDPPRRRAW